MRGLCNGTLMILHEMKDRVLEVELVGGDHNEEIALLPRLTLDPEASPQFAFKFSRRQFPVRLAFALSINKSQGQYFSHIRWIKPSCTSILTWSVVCGLI